MSDVKIHPMQFTFMDLKHINFGFLIRNSQMRSIYYGHPEPIDNPVDLIQLVYTKGDEVAKQMILDAYKSKKPIAVGTTEGKGEQHEIPFRDYAMVIDGPQEYSIVGGNHTAEIIPIESLA